MNPVTPSELAAFLATLKGAQPVSVSALTKTDARLPDGREVWKLNRVHSFNRFDYAGAVNRERTREGLTPDFTPKPRAWGRFVSAWLVEHKGQHYIPLRVLRTGRPTYFTRDAAGFLRYLKTDEVKPYLPPDTSGAAQGLDKPVICRDYRLDNLVSVSVAGKRLKLVRG